MLGTFIAILGCMQPVGHRLDTPESYRLLKTTMPDLTPRDSDLIVQR